MSKARLRVLTEFATREKRRITARPHTQELPFANACSRQPTAEVQPQVVKLTSSRWDGRSLTTAGASVRFFFLHLAY